MFLSNQILCWKTMQATSEILICKARISVYAPAKIVSGNAGQRRTGEACGNFMTLHIIQSSRGESKEIISFEAVRRRGRIGELEFFMNFYQETKTSLEQSSYELVNFIWNWLLNNFIPSSYDVTKYR